MWRFLMMLAWMLFLEVGFLAHEALAPRIHGDFLQWLLGVATLLLSIAAGIQMQTWLLATIDPDGERRRDIREAQRTTT